MSNTARGKLVEGSGNPLVPYRFFVWPPVSHGVRCRVILVEDMKKNAYLKLLVSAVIVTLFLTYLARSGQFSFSEVLGVIRTFPLSAVVLALVACCLQLFFGMVRFWLLFQPADNPGFLKVIRAISLGQWANTFLPARAGDVAKAVLVSRGSITDPSVATGAGVVLTDKVIDISSLVLLIIATRSWAIKGFELPDIPAKGVWIVLFSILVLVVLWGVSKRKRLVNLSGWLTSFLAGLRGMLHPARFPMAVSLSVFAWLFEILALYVLASTQDFSLGLAELVYTLTLLNLAISVPISVANVGPFEASIVFALSVFGVPTTQALAIASVHHFLQALAISLWALVSLIFLRNKSDPEKEFRVQVQDKMKAIEYFEKVSNQYDETVSRGILRIPRDRERKAVLELSGLVRDRVGSLIDVGCGAGFYALEAKKRGWKVRAVDASQGMVLKLLGKVDEVEVADIEALSMHEQFDRVICAGVLDFVLRPESSFRNLCQLVAPGGKLIVLAPRKGPGGLFYRVEKWFFGVSINLYTLGWFKELAGRSGLILVDFEYPLPTNMAVAFERPSKRSNSV